MQSTSPIPYDPILMPATPTDFDRVEKGIDDLVAKQESQIQELFIKTHPTFKDEALQKMRLTKNSILLRLQGLKGTGCSYDTLTHVAAVMHAELMTTAHKIAQADLAFKIEALERDLKLAKSIDHVERQNRRDQYSDILVE